MEPVYYGYLGTNHECPDYQGALTFQVSLHDALFGTVTKFQGGSRMEHLGEIPPPPSEAYQE